MSKLITPKQSVVSKEDLVLFMNFFKKNENFSKHSNIIETINVEGGTLEIGLYLDKDNNTKEDVFKVYAKYDFGGKDYEWMRLYVDKDGSVKHNIHVPNDINTIEGLKNFITYSEYLDDVIINNIDIEKYLSFVPMFQMMSDILGWNCNYREIFCVFSEYDLDTYDKHQIHKVLWKLKTEDLNEIFSSKNGYDCYNGWRTKNDTLKMLGNSIDNMVDTVNLIKEYNETYS